MQTLKSKVGGNFDAVDHGDGTFDLLGVPIFAEVPAGERHNQKPIGFEWMKRALERNRARKGEGHLPPVHIHHHDEGVTPSYAGKMELTRVGQIQYEGKKVWAIFADIHDIPENVFEQIKRGFIPYRSVEIHNWDTPEIDSLALMPSEVPFFRMPMTTVGEVRKAEPNFFNMPGNYNSPAFMWKDADSKGRKAILFRFEKEGHMADDEKKEAEEKEACKKKMQDEEEKKKEESEKAQDEEKKVDPEEKLQNDVPNTPANQPAPAAAPNPQQIMQQIMQLLQQLVQAGQPKPPQAGEQLAPVQSMSDKSKEASMAETTPNEEVAKLRAEVDGLKQKDEQREKADKVQAIVQKARADLVGRNVGEKMFDTIAEFAAQPDGEKLVTAYVERLKEVVPTDPPKDLLTFEAEVGNSKDAEAFEKFSEKHKADPKAMEKAHRFAAEWKELCKVTRRDEQLPLADYLAARMKVAEEDAKQERKEG